MDRERPATTATMRTKFEKEQATQRWAAALIGALAACVHFGRPASLEFTLSGRRLCSSSPNNRFLPIIGLNLAAACSAVKKIFSNTPNRT